MNQRLNKAYIRHRMVDLGIPSYAELSRRAGLHRITVSAVLARGSCAWTTLEALAQVLDCQPADLLRPRPPDTP